MGGPDSLVLYYTPSASRLKNPNEGLTCTTPRGNAAIVHWPTLIVQWPIRPLADLNSPPTHRALKSSHDAA